MNNEEVAERVARALHPYSFTCYHCGVKIPENEPVVIKGRAAVEGFASLGDFHDNGAIMTVLESYDEEAVCPKCGEYFTPDFRHYRRQRRESDPLLEE